MTSPTKTGNKAVPVQPPKLKPAQIKAMDMMLAGIPLQDIAEELTLSRQTLSEWKNKHPVFRAKLEELRAEAEAELSYSIPMNNAFMVSNLRKLVQDAPPSIRLDAIKFYFDRFGAGDSQILTEKDQLILRALQKVQD